MHTEIYKRNEEDIETKNSQWGKNNFVEERQTGKSLMKK